jgi:hypothetical protein
VQAAQETLHGLQTLFESAAFPVSQLSAQTVPLRTPLEQAVQVFSSMQAEQFFEQLVQIPAFAKNPVSQVTRQELPCLLNPETQLVQLFLSAEVQSEQLVSQAVHLVESSKNPTPQSLTHLLSWVR